MKLLIKTILMLMFIFFSTFLIIKFTGVLSVEDIKHYFELLKEQPHYFIGILVIILLFADLFIAVPTMTIIILAGYFIGFELAVLYAFTGLFGASFFGYFISRLYGEKLLKKVSKDEEQIIQMKKIFNQHGMIMLMLSRAMPMLTEISSCLAGTCKMPLSKYLLGWSIGTIPYLLLISYAGSISDLNNPKPVLITAFAITGVLWLSWFIFMRRKMPKKIKNTFESN